VDAIRRQFAFAMEKVFSCPVCTAQSRCPGRSTIVADLGSGQEIVCPTGLRRNAGRFALQGGDVVWRTACASEVTTCAQELITHAVEVRQVFGEGIQCRAILRFGKRTRVVIEPGPLTCFQPCSQPCFQPSPKSLARTAPSAQVRLKPRIKSVCFIGSASIDQP
jgi:hypothetical protein